MFTPFPQFCSPSRRDKPPGTAHPSQTRTSALFLLAVVSLYCLWCIQRTYWSTPRLPALGEEADLGVLVYLGLFFFLPHYLCLAATHPREKPPNLFYGGVPLDDVL